MGINGVIIKWLIEKVRNTYTNVNSTAIRINNILF